MKILVKFPMLKKVILLAIFSLSAISIFAQTPGWSSATGYGGNREDRTYAITVDNNGNFYLAGDYMSGSLVLGPNTLTNTNVTSTNILLVKLSSDGTVQWAKGFGDAGNDYAKSVAVDASGNVILVGSFDSDSITFDGTKYFKNICQGCGWKDLFVVKFASNGNVLWAKTAGGIDWEYANDVATDNAGNIFVAGSFSSDTVTFDTVTIAMPNNNLSIFLAKFDAAGNLKWVRAYGSDLYNEATGVATDNNGNSYITGNFDDLMMSVGTYSLINNGQTDAFLIKFDPNGNPLWAKNAGNLLFDYSKAVATDASGNVYITGEFNGDNITFGAYTVQNNAPASNNNDIFVAKYSSDGTAQYAKSFGGFGDEYVFDIAVDASNCAYVSGSYVGESLIATPRILYNSNKNVGEMFLIKLNANSDVGYAVRATGSSDDNGTGVTTYQGIAYGTGYFRSSNMKFSWLPVSNNGILDFFFGKIGLVNSTEEISAGELQMYPNPSSDGSFNLRPGKLMNGNYHLGIYDAIGNLVMGKNINISGSYDIDLSLSDPKPGIYQVELISGNGEKYTGKLLVR